MHAGAMAGRNVLLLVLVTVALWQGWVHWHLRPVHPPDGMIAPSDPVQINLDPQPPVAHGRWLLEPRATYDITARILSREDYHFDAISDLVPEDLALGWGPMSDNRILKSFEITQDYRFYFWRARHGLPIPRDVVIEHSANTHVIPADAFVRSQLRKLRAGQVVHLVGVLVDGMRNDGRILHTSMTRIDTGPGACEIMLVQEVEIEPTPTS
jgi:hypothetical protein